MTLPIPELHKRGSDDSTALHASAVQSMFDRIAPTYDMLNHVMSAGIDTLWRRRAVRALRWAPEGPILDLCAGTLDTSALIARKMPDRRIVAADFSSEMLAKGADKVPSAERIVADAMNLPFADNEFAAVICAFGMRNIADPGRAVREVQRVLMHGGYFVTLEFYRPTQFTTRAFHAAYGRMVLPRVGGALSGDREAYAYLSKSIDGFCSKTEYEELLIKNGMSAVQSRDLTLSIASIVRARALK